VLVSVLVHGASVVPLATWYGHHRPGTPRAEQPEADRSVPTQE
jgi:hypothetical protein